MPPSPCLWNPPVPRCFAAVSLSQLRFRRPWTIPIMTTSRRLADRKIAKFEKNITKRGFVPERTVKKGNDYPVGPIGLAFFVFVVVGSSLFQIIRTATSGGFF